MSALRKLLKLLIFIAIANVAEAKYKMGVNYGQLGNNLPAPVDAVAMIQRLNIGHVKIYDANPEILKALSGTGITVAAMVTDAEVPGVATNQSTADAWVKHNVSMYYPGTQIRTILVGNEILSDQSQESTWRDLVPAMKRLRAALAKYGLSRRIKISTTVALDVLEGQAVFPPSNGTFRANVKADIMKPMLEFLEKTKSSLFIDAYPYFGWENDAAVVPLGFALFENNESLWYKDSLNGLVYENLLDVQLDAMTAAMAEVGYENVQVTLSETGWPTKEDPDERGANIHNAALYNRRLARKMVAHPPFGTPRRPGQYIPTYIFALFNENEKSGETTERNWGLLYPNGTQVYEVDLTGQLPDSLYAPLPPSPIEPSVGSQKFWCVANASASSSSLEAGLEYACEQATSICSPIKVGKSCYKPNTLLSHASYAFNAYYVKFKAIGGSCSFGGAAQLTTKDPSYGSCKYSPYVF